VLDIGTVAFAIVLPRLLREFWNTSAFTRMLTLSGANDAQSVVLTLHSTGHYLIKKSWDLAKGDVGISGLAESGTFWVEGGAFELKSDFGRRRRLVGDVDHGFLVDDRVEDRPEWRAYSLQGWLLKP
jgi:hypothetical protein